MKKFLGQMKRKAYQANKKASNEAVTKEALNTERAFRISLSIDFF